MFITKKNRMAVYSYLFKEGVLVAKKDTFAPQHSEAIQVPNLEVIMMMKTFKSKGLVKETFNWGYYYWYLTNEGIEYLRQYLALPADIVPATLKAAPIPTRPTGDKQVPEGEFSAEFQRGERRGRREGYRA